MLIMAHPRMEWLTLVHRLGVQDPPLKVALVHRLRVQDPWLKVLQQEQPVLVQLQILCQQPPVPHLSLILQCKYRDF